MIFYIFLFLISSLALAFAGKWTVGALTKIAYLSHWREFIVAFFAVSLGAVAPEFFIGIVSALRSVPELSFGNVVGQNIILFTLAVTLSTLVLKGSMDTNSRTVKATSNFAVVAAVLPIILAFNGVLSRIDGIILILSFVFFVSWLFKKEERFTKIYDEKLEIKKKDFSRELFKNVAIAFGGLALIVLSAEGIINSAIVFSKSFQIAIPIVGIVIVAAGTGFPEIYFSIKLAFRGNSWMILGGIMGAIAMSSTLVLGTVALINPIKIDNFSPFAISFIFLILSALLFFIFIRTKNKITKKEAVFLLLFYILFVLSILIIGN